MTAPCAVVCGGGEPEITDLYLEPSLLPVVTRAQLRAKDVVAHCVVDFKCPGVSIVQSGYSVGVAIDGVVPCTKDLPASVVATDNSTKMISTQWTATDIDPDGDGMFIVQCFVVGNGCPCNEVIQNQIKGQYAVIRLVINDGKYSSPTHRYCLLECEDVWKCR